MNIFAAGISCNKFIRLIRLYTLGMTEKNILFLFHEFRGKTFDIYFYKAQFVKRKTTQKHLFLLFTSLNFL